MKTKAEFVAAMEDMSKEAQSSGFSFICAASFTDGNYTHGFAGEKMHLIGLSGILEHEIKTTSLQRKKQP